MTALDYIRDKGLDHRVTAGQVVLKRCPFCGDEAWHFYIDQGEEGPFFCHKCQERGNLVILRRHFGEIPLKSSSGNGNGTRKTQTSGISQAFPKQDRGNHRPDTKTAIQAHEKLLRDPKALSYVTEARGIGMEAVKYFRLGLHIDKDGSRWLTFPHYVKGELINIKFRSLPPMEKTFRRVPGCPSVFFNADALEDQTEIYLTEGEIDAVTLWDQGIKNVVGTTTGAGSFDPEWIDQLRSAEKIYLCYDPDEPGQKGAREAARRLGFDRCINVVLPDGQDVNEFFRAGKDIFDFQALVNKAGQFDVAGVMSIEKALDRFSEELKRPVMQTGILTPWAEVNRLIRTGLQPGDLCVLSSPPKIGKTTIALQIASCASLNNTPTLFCCLEMRPLKLIQKIVQCEIRAEVIGQEALTRARTIFSGKPLYLCYCYQKPELSGIIQTLKEAIRRYGLKFLVFDHLHFLCRSITNQVQEIGLAVQAFKFLTEEMEIPILLIAQPRKIQPDSIMTAMDLKDSSSIFSDCDHLIILHRQRVTGSRKTMDGREPPHNQAYEPITLVRVEASRYNPGGEALLYFHGEWSRFDPIEKSSTPDFKKRMASDYE